MCFLKILGILNQSSREIQEGRFMILFLQRNKLIFCYLSHAIIERSSEKLLIKGDHQDISLTTPNNLAGFSREESDMTALGTLRGLVAHILLRLELVSLLGACGLALLRNLTTIALILLALGNCLLKLRCKTITICHANRILDRSLELGVANSARTGHNLILIRHLCLPHLREPIVRMGTVRKVVEARYSAH